MGIFTFRKAKQPTFLGKVIAAICAERGCLKKMTPYEPQELVWSAENDGYYRRCGKCTAAIKKARIRR